MRILDHVILYKIRFFNRSLTEGKKENSLTNRLLQVVMNLPESWNECRFVHLPSNGRGDGAVIPSVRATKKCGKELARFVFDPFEKSAQ